MERHDAVAQGLAHPANLAIASLGQDDPKAARPETLDAARSRLAAENHHPRSHVVQERLVEGAIHVNLILLLMTIFSTENLIDDVSVVRQQDEPGRIFIQSADWEDPFWMADEADDVAGDMWLAGRGDSDRFMELDVESTLLPGDHDAVPGNDIVWPDLVAENRSPAIKGHAAFFDKAVGLAPGA